MAKETLTVKNFGPIREAHLELGKVTVFIGKQASGKSVLAKLLMIFSDAIQDRKISSSMSQYNIASFTQQNTIISFKNQLFSNSFDGELTQDIIDLSLKSRFKEYGEVRMKFRKAVDGLQGNSALKEERESARNLRDEMRAQRNGLRNLVGESNYFPAERGLISVLSKTIFQIVEKDVKLPSFLLDFASSYEVARESLIQLPINFLNITYTFKGGKDRVIINGNNEIDLDESATGFQTAIPMALVIESLQEKGKHLFIIEEPELNLYPSTQKRLVEYLIEKCTKGDNRLIITTHSPYILTVLDNCIQASNVLKVNPGAQAEVDTLVLPASQIDFEDVAAYFVADGTAKSIMNAENRLIDGNALDEISDELGETFDRLLNLELQPT